MSAEPRQFQLVLKAGPNVANPIAELRALLKRALRVHGLECLLCAPEPSRPATDGKTVDNLED